MNNIKASSNGLSLASLIFGILAVLGSFMMFTTPIFSGLAITFAWLSRGDKKLSNQAIAGNILAIIAIVISLIIFIILLFYMIVWAAEGLDALFYTFEQLL